uniref:Alpha-carbonic anhydrase domain-containing protein n=1 Tax=Timema douglasi TaxID=61478 RepID=A0A7R8VNY7_TIMDO|nr:unnamed protein product [Timema douglasi]
MTGPTHWAESYQTCSGKYQSPIDIEEHLVSQVRLPPLNFQGFKSKSVSSTLTNNGHTVHPTRILTHDFTPSRVVQFIASVMLQTVRPPNSPMASLVLSDSSQLTDNSFEKLPVVLQLNTSDEAILSGGPLKGNYIFAQLHFHWGANDSIGSEDTINNHTFPLELHLVFFKQDYVSFNHALDFKDGLTVLAVFFEVYGDDNDIYSDIVSHLPRVVNPGTNARLKRPVTLDSLLPSIRHLYFTYEGSLTTPPCSEVVTWIDFKQPILLSARQVNAFRKLRSEEGTLTQNFRPVQPLSGRLIHFNVADDLSRSGESSVLRSVPVGALCITAAVLTLQAMYSRNLHPDLITDEQNKHDIKARMRGRCRARPEYRRSMSLVLVRSLTQYLESRQNLVPGWLRLYSATTWHKDDRDNCFHDRPRALLVLRLYSARTQRIFPQHGTKTIETAVFTTGLMLY